MFNFFSNLFKRWFKKGETPASAQPSVAEDLAQRLQRAAESILENESLTADLDDDAARALLDWGLACAQKVAQDTAGFEALAAETSLADRLQATRRLMRAASRWVLGQQEMDPASASDALSTVMEQASVIYGKKFTLPVQAQYTAFLAEQAPGEPVQMVTKLRELIEGNLRKN
jgi:hypothetical protein